MPIQSPDSMQTAVSLPAGGTPGTGYSTLRLTLTNGDGDAASATVKVHWMVDGPVDGLFYVVRPPEIATPFTQAFVAGPGPDSEFRPPLFDTGRWLWSFSGVRPDTVATWQFIVGAPIGQPLAVGRYEQTRYLFIGPQYPIVEARLQESTCIDARGHFDILEIDVDASGQLRRLAVDFEHLCEGAVEAWRGSFRYRSAIPVGR